MAFPASSCVGTLACEGVTGSIGENSCNGQQACQGLVGDVGANSCNGTQACQGLGNDDASVVVSVAAVTPTVGSGSCNGTQACQGAFSTPLDVFTFVAAAEKSIGNYSCNGTLACQGVFSAPIVIPFVAADELPAESIGNYSCNGSAACQSLMASVGDCQNNASVPAACAVRKPDGHIRRSGGARHGQNVYNLDAVGQMSIEAPRRYRVGAVRWYYVYVQNDGDAADSFTVGAADNTPGGSAGYSVRYFRPAGAEITAAVESGTFTTPELGPGRTFAIRARVQVLAGAVRGSQVQRLFTITSVGDSAVKDAVGFLMGRR